MTKFSANLGFMWTELPLPKAIETAAQHGFDAVECHFPYQTPVDEVTDALNRTGLKMLGLNTIKGNEPGDNGLCALPDRVTEARAAIDQAIDYAVAIKTPNIHVMAGNTSGEAADKTFMENLRYATDIAGSHGITILIEPLNPYDAPGYYLNSTKLAKRVIESVKVDNLKLMFDCYHIQIIEGDVCRKFKALQPLIGHVQMASVPDRAEPDTGELDYSYVLKIIEQLGYSAPIGAEYKPSGKTESTLDWMQTLR